jgi:tetratricopeptide (TPR) repeat protein
VSSVAFDAKYKRQVNELGNLVRGLEMIIEYSREHSHTGAAALLVPDIRRILTRLPRSRVRPELLEEISELTGTEPHGELFAPEPPAGSRSPNAIVMPFVEQNPDAAGLVRDFRVELAEPFSHQATFPIEADRQFRRALTAGCEAAARVLEAAGVLPLYKIPEDYVFHLEELPSGGNPPLSEPSGWLAAFLSYISLIASLPIPRPIAATGYLAGDGCPGPPAHVDRKIAACRRERADVEQILVLSDAEPSADYGAVPKVAYVRRPEDAITAVWGSAWRDAVRPPKLTFYAAFDRAMYAYAREHDLAGALKRFLMLRRFLAGDAQFSLRYRLLCDWRVASCYTHLWMPDLAGPVFDEWTAQLDDLLERGDIDAENYAEFLATYAVHLEHVGALGDGIRLIESALTKARAYHAPRSSLARLQAALGRLMTAAGDYTRAEKELLQAYELVENEEKPKKCIHLARLYIAGGQYERAQEFLDDAQELCSETHLSTGRRTTVFYRALWQSRLDLGNGDEDLAAARFWEALGLLFADA